MKKMTKRTLSLLLVVAMICSLGVLALADTTDPDANKTITVNPTSQTVYAGATKTITLTALVGSYSEGDTVTWKAVSATATSPASKLITLSGDTSSTTAADGSVTTKVATGGTTTVTVTAPTDSSVTDTVKVTAALNGKDKTADCTVYVVPDNVQSVDIVENNATVTDKTVTITKNDTVAFSATVNHLNGVTYSNDAITWKSNNAAAANVSNTGTVTGLSVGSAVITATSGGKSAAVTVNVVESSAAAAPTITVPSAATTYYLAKSGSKALEINAAGTGTLTYQWYSKSSSDTAYTKITNGTSSIYTASGSSVGTMYYYCTVTNEKKTASSDSPVYTVIVKDAYDVTLTGTTAVNKGSAATMTAYVVQNTVSTDNKLTQTPVTSAKALAWTIGDKGSYLSFDSAKAVAAATSDISNGYASVTVYGNALKVDGVTLTASYTPVTGSTYTAAQTVKVVTSSVNAAAAVPAGGSALSMTDTNGYTAASVESQLKSGIADLSYVQFNTAAATGTTYGKFSAVNGTSYYVGSSWWTTNLSSVTFTPGSKAGTYTVPYTAYNSSNTALTVGTLTITVKDAATGTGDISYNVKVGASVSLTDSDFESWYENQTSASYSLISVRFNSLPTAGTMKYSGSSSSLYFNTSTDYYTNGNGSGTSPKYLANVSYTAPSTAGNYAVSFTCTGKYGTSTRTVSGTLMFCVNKGTVTDITYKAVYGQDLSLAESDFTAVYKTATSSTATSPKFTIRFVTLPSKGTLYRDGYTTSAYKVTTGTSYNVNAAITTAYDVDDITYVPGKYTSGSETATYQAYDAAGTLQYTGNIVFSYTTNNKPMSCYSEGYTFAKGDFVSTGDTDPVSYVMFTGISAGGSLYRDYNYGKGYPVGPSMKFYMSTSVTGGYPITSLTFIPKAEYIGNVAMTYTAVTKAGKTSTGTINMYCDARTSALKFNDVNASWAVPAVDFTSCWGLVTGSGGGTFNPTGTMQRAMLVTILYRMAGSPSVSGLSNPFKDVPAGTWYTNAVIWASHNGVVNGTGKTTFSPTNPVARQDIAAILWRYEGQPSGNAYALSGYTDAGSISSYAKSAMQWAVSAGVITGSGSRLNPQASGTRAEVCVMLYRLLAA